MRRAILLLALLSSAAWAQEPATPGGRAALDILKRSVAFPTVEGRGQVPAYAAYLKQVLVAQGFAAADVTFVPMGETGYLTARWPGRDRKAKPIAVLAHMDVVEAKRDDWQRDPFVATMADGYVYGRGALDNKADLSMLVAALGELRKAKWVPGRDLILAFSGDEEMAMATTKAMLATLPPLEMALNTDAGGGLLGEDGKPAFFTIQAAEKAYADYTLTVTDPGGHSSRPGATNAIYRLNAGLAKLAAYGFPVEVSPVTRASLVAQAGRMPAATGAAMRAIAADPKDAAAAATLTADPGLVGQIRTTCVATQITGGHAPNALPQRAEANVNCRIFPGHSFDEIAAELRRVVADPGIVVAYKEMGTIPSPESPLRPDVLRAVTAAVQARAPGLTVLPGMEAGATDGMHFRAKGVPTYGVGTVFMKSSDDRAHGLDERLPLATIDPGVAQWQAMLKALLK
jgi:acetylornithine deacetylase/succinyl-diaminopimelate desuccinylase-like protein